MKQITTILLILFLAFVLRVIHLDQSLWLDEAISALAARDFTFYGIVNDFLKADNHPPFFYMTLRAWGLLVGFSDVGLRLLSVTFGVITVFLTYLIVRKLFQSTKFALTSALFLATSPLHVYYSQEIRMYPMIAFEAAFIIYLFLKISEENAKKLYWFLFSASLLILCATDYVTIFFLPVLPLVALVQKKDLAWWTKFLISGLPLGVAAFFWLPFFYFQTEVGRDQVIALPGWAALAGGANFKELILVWMKFVLGRISFENKTFYYGLIAVCSGLFIFIFSLSAKHFKKYTFFWVWLILPLILGFITSFLIPAFTYFRFIYVLPAFYVLLAAGLKEIHKLLLRRVIAGLVIIVHFLGLWFYYSVPDNRRENWQEAIHYLEINAEAEDLALFEFPEPFAPYRWYSRGEVEGFGATDALLADDEKTRVRLESRLATLTGDIYHFAYLRDLTDPNKYVESHIQELGYKKTESTSFIGVGEISKYVKMRENPVLEVVNQDD